MKNIDFIIYYEHVPREWNSVCRLKKELNNLGLNGVIFPKHFYKYKSLIKYRPKIIILPYLYSRKNDQHLMFEEIYGSIPVLNIHSEQLHDETTKAFQMPHDDYAASCYHISWGEKFADALIESGVNSELIFKTGSIRNDDTFAKEDSKLKKNRVLIPTAFSKTFVSEIYIDKLTSLDAIDREKYLSKLRYTTQVRDAFFRDIYTLAKELNDKDFVFRPHPYVELDDYIKCFCQVNKIKSLPKNVFVERNGSIQDDIANSEKVVTWYSSTALDAFLMGRDVVIYEPVVTPKYMKISFLNYFNSESNLAGLKKFIIRGSDIKDMLETNEYINLVYGPVDGKNCRRVASVVYGILNEQRCNNESINYKKYIKYFLKYIYIDVPKLCFRKLGLLPYIKPFYKGVLDDNRINDDAKKFRKIDEPLNLIKENNGYKVG